MRKIIGCLQTKPTAYLFRDMPWVFNGPERFTSSRARTQEDFCFRAARNRRQAYGKASRDPLRQASKRIPSDSGRRPVGRSSGARAHRVFANSRQVPSNRQTARIRSTADTIAYAQSVRFPDIAPAPLPSGGALAFPHRRSTCSAKRSREAWRAQRSRNPFAARKALFRRAA